MENEKVDYTTNWVAQELSSPKYRGKVQRDRTKYDRKERKRTRSLKRELGWV